MMVFCLVFGLFGEQKGLHIASMRKFFQNPKRMGFEAQSDGLQSVALVAVVSMLLMFSYKNSHPKPQTLLKSLYTSLNAACDDLSSSIQ